MTHIRKKGLENTEVTTDRRKERGNLHNKFVRMNGTKYQTRKILQTIEVRVIPTNAETTIESTCE